MNLLADILMQRTAPASLCANDWDQLLAQARNVNMIARLGASLDAVMDRRDWPIVAREVVEGTERYVSYLQMRARHEAEQLSATIGDCEHPIVLLKGAAYIFSGTEVAKGRGLSDIDIMVPKSEIVGFANTLHDHGWKYAEELSEYDHYYYRELAHELPPLRHPQAQLELDVHHNILQPTHRYRVDTEKLFARATPVPGTPFSTFALEDQILHSATHLTMSDELRGGLRDIHDISLLLQSGVNKNNDFVGLLVDRAHELNLTRALFYTMQFAALYLGTQSATDVFEQLRKDKPSFLIDKTMRALIKLRLSPSIQPNASSLLANQLLYIRSHWIRMPPLLLAKHLSRKLLTPRPST